MAEDLLAGRYGGLVTAAAGAVTGLVFFRKASVVESAMSVFAGLAMAVFVAPAATEYFGIVSVKMDRAVTYMMGVFGIMILSGVFALLKKWQADPLAFIDILRGRRSGASPTGGTGETK